MEEQKLISMTEYVLENEKILLRQVKNFKKAELKVIDYSNYADRITNYANFLKSPLELGMFIPTDKEGNVLEEPKAYCYYQDLDKYEYNEIDVKQYQEALDRILFEGFSYNDNGGNRLYWNGTSVEHSIQDEINIKETIEVLTGYSDLTLTESAIKLIS